MHFNTYKPSHTHLPLRMAASRSERASLIGIIPSMVDFLVCGAASPADWPTAACGGDGWAWWPAGAPGGGGGGAAGGAPDGGWEGDGT